jgi:hypothetical protein
MQFGENNIRHLCSVLLCSPSTYHVLQRMERLIKMDDSWLAIKLYR